MKKLWFPKRVRFAPENYASVRAAATCPDQRVFRRLTLQEREAFLKASGK